MNPVLLLRVYLFLLAHGRVRLTSRAGRLPKRLAGLPPRAVKEVFSKVSIGSLNEGGVELMVGLVSGRYSIERPPMLADCALLCSSNFDHRIEEPRLNHITREMPKKTADTFRALLRKLWEDGYGFEVYGPVFVARSRRSGSAEVLKVTEEGYENVKLHISLIRCSKVSRSGWVAGMINGNYAAENVHTGEIRELPWATDVFIVSESIFGCDVDDEWYRHLF